MTNSSDPRPLKTLEDRIAALKSAQSDPAGSAENAHSQAQLAWRMVIELVAGLAIGFGIGFGLDAVLNTRPWLMVVFTVLGFIAGIKTMIRSAEEIQRKAQNVAGSAPDTERM